MAMVRDNAKIEAGAFSVAAILAAPYHLPLYLLPPHMGGQRAGLAFGGTR